MRNYFGENFVGASACGEGKHLCWQIRFGCCEHWQLHVHVQSQQSGVSGELQVHGVEKTARLGHVLAFERSKVKSTQSPHATVVVVLLHVPLVQFQARLCVVCGCAAEPVAALVQHTQQGKKRSCQFPKRRLGVCRDVPVENVDVIELQMQLRKHPMTTSTVSRNGVLP